MFLCSEHAQRSPSTGTANQHTQHMRGCTQQPLSSNSTQTEPIWLPSPSLGHLCLPQPCQQPQSRAQLLWQGGKCSGTVTQGHVGPSLVPQPRNPQLCPLLTAGMETSTQIWHFFLAHCREREKKRSTGTCSLIAFLFLCNENPFMLSLSTLSLCS